MFCNPPARLLAAPIAGLWPTRHRTFDPRCCRSAFRVLLCLFMMLGVSAAHAQSGSSALRDVYAEIQIGAGGVRHSDLDFYPTYGNLTAGVFIYPGIGIEAFADTALAAGEEGAFELEVAQAVGAAVRLQSPPQDGLQAFVALGYVAFSLDQQEEQVGADPTISEDFTGVRFGIGMMQRLQRFPNLLVTAEYRNYYVDAGIQVDGFGLGLRISLP